MTVPGMGSRKADNRTAAKKDYTAGPGFGHKTNMRLLTYDKTMWNICDIKGATQWAFYLQKNTLRKYVKAYEQCKYDEQKNTETLTIQTINKP